VPQLRSIFGNLNAHVRGSEAMGSTSERYGSLLTPVVMSRMPLEITLQVARKIEEDEWTIFREENIVFASSSMFSSKNN